MYKTNEDLIIKLLGQPSTAKKQEVSGYTRLALAIVGQAVIDILEEGDHTRDALRFLYSDWYEALIDLDRDRLMDLIKKKLDAKNHKTTKYKYIKKI